MAPTLRAWDPVLSCPRREGSKRRSRLALAPHGKAIVVIGRAQLTAGRERKAAAALWFDRLRRRHAAIAFPLAVKRKYSDDRAGYLAATISYYGFFSLFPLLLVLVTVLGYVLDGRPGLQHRIVDSALGQFPIIGPELEQHSLKGSGLALAVGIAVSLWTGTSVFLAAENAMNRIWGVPADELPGLVSSRLRALGLLAVLGAGLLTTAVLTGIGANGGSLGIALRAGTVVGSLVANFFLFWLAFRLLTLGSVETRTLRVGAAAAAAGYQVLQLVGSYYVGRTLTNASNVYGTFALVIGLLSWIYLTATIVLVSAEINVVAARRLWREPTDV